MVESTRIHTDKINAYLATCYKIIDASEQIILRIGQRSLALSELLAKQGVDCGALITSFNPLGTIQSDQANRAAHTQLGLLFKHAGITTLPALGCDETLAWPEEKSYFALGLSKEESKLIGQRFNQDAIVWVGPDAVAQLVLLRE